MGAIDRHTHLQLCNLILSEPQFLEIDKCIEILDGLVKMRGLTKRANSHTPVFC